MSDTLIPPNHVCYECHYASDDIADFEVHPEAKGEMICVDCYESYDFASDPGFWADKKYDEMKDDEMLGVLEDIALCWSKGNRA